VSDKQDDERMLASVARGYWYSLMLAAWGKRLLTSQDLSIARRLEMLERLGDCVHGALTPAALAAIAPAGETTAEIIETALRLDLDANSETGELSFRVLTRPDVFATLLKPEPSLFDAIRLMSRH